MKHVQFILDISNTTAFRKLTQNHNHSFSQRYLPAYLVEVVGNHEFVAVYDPHGTGQQLVLRLVRADWAAVEGLHEGAPPIRQSTRDAAISLGVPLPITWLETLSVATRAAVTPQPYAVRPVNRADAPAKSHVWRG